jgi:acetoin utilization protein AcuC
MELTARRKATDLDPILYLNMTDTFNNQLLVLLVIVNDPESPRFNIDVDDNGNSTHLGTTSRNQIAEIEAMKSGLSPGQIRRGLGTFKQSVPLFEKFVQNLGHDLFLIEPLAYHNAILFERYGFNYIRGYRDMRHIHEGFQPGGELYQKLSPDKPFRQPEVHKTVRGRSWAIHDGILGHPFTGFQMYKRVGIHAGINTFPDGQW